MSNAGELFGNDSSSDEEDVPVKESTVDDPPKETHQAVATDGVPERTEEQGRTAPEKDHGNNEEEDDAEDKKGDTIVAAPSKSSSSSSKPSPKKKPSIMDADSDDDDDDDENEPEFAVVGSSAKNKTKTSSSGAPAGSSTRQSNAAPVRRKEDDLLNDEEDNDDDDEMSKEDDAEEVEVGDTRTLVVQESTRPPSQSLFMTRMPNLVGVQTTAFDEIDYSKRQEDEDFGKAAYNLIRWRYKTNSSGDPVRGDNDELIRESNTRLVEWEDGSYTMHVGEEVFTIDMIDSSQSNGFPGLNGYLCLSTQAASYKEDGTPAGTVLECMGAIGSRMGIKPTSLQSDAHKILTHGIRQKTIKAARMAEIVTQHDPEKEKLARLKMRSDLDKVNVRKGITAAGGGGSTRPRMSRRYMNQGEEEEEDDEDTYNLKKMKRRAMDGGYDDEESEVEEYGDSFRQAKKKKKEESSEDEEMELDDEDEDAPIMASKKKRQMGQTGLFDDSDSD
jgi:RNA polymerase-associated protein LEO1